jgi:hypothetical protein
MYSIAVNYGNISSVLSTSVYQPTDTYAAFGGGARETSNVVYEQFAPTPGTNANANYSSVADALADEPVVYEQLAPT